MRQEFYLGKAAIFVARAVTIFIMLNNFIIFRVIG
jgi:hypothetical protein